MKNYRVELGIQIGIEEALYFVYINVKVYLDSSLFLSYSFYTPTILTHKLICTRPIASANKTKVPVRFVSDKCCPKND